MSGGSAGGEIMLFGVRVKVDPMRKCVSMNNMSQYEQPQESSKAADGCYASADEAIHHPSSRNRDRKRGVPWTEGEHKLFILGLQKVGKGDWRGISRNFVKTRTPTQVASHAQKYFLRQSSINRRRRRSSLFDITTESAIAIPTEEEKVHQERKTRPLLPPTQLPPPESLNINGYQELPYPVTVGPVLIPVQIEDPIEKLTLGQADLVNLEPENLICPFPVLPMLNASTMVDLDLNLKSAVNLSRLSLKLSLSSDQNQLSRHSVFEVLSNLNNGDSIISVA